MQKIFGVQLCWLQSLDCHRSKQARFDHPLHTVDLIIHEGTPRKKTDRKDRGIDNG